MPDPDLHRYTADIVAAYAAHNDSSIETVPDLIRSVYNALNRANDPSVSAQQLPAVPIKESVFPNFIVCLEDGLKLKMLRRHLWTSYGMTPDDYRAKWNLPDHYPMVAPNYAATRSKMAKQIGLGRRKGERQTNGGVAVQRIPEGMSSKSAKAKRLTRRM